MLILKKENKEKTTVYCGRRGPAIFRWNGAAHWGAQKNRIFQKWRENRKGYIVDMLYYSLASVPTFAADGDRKSVV